MRTAEVGTILKVKVLRFRGTGIFFFPLNSEDVRPKRCQLKYETKNWFKALVGVLTHDRRDETG